MKIELDEGYAFGLGFFETWKVKEGRVFFLEEHLARLEKSLKAFGIEQKVTKEDVLDYVSQQEEEDFALKCMVSLKNVVFTKRKDPYKGQEARGKRACISSVLRNSSSPLVGHKSLNYAENILEKRRATAAGYDEVLFFNEKGHLTEGAVSNVFFVKGEKLYTPSCSEGLLPGTVRDYLMKTERVEEKSIRREDLADFDACLLTNSLMGLFYLESLEDWKYKKTAYVERLLEEFRRLGF